MYKERIANLLNAIDKKYLRSTKERDKAIDIVEVGLELFPRCSSATCSKNVTLEMAKFRVEPNVYDGMKRDLDNSRQWLCDATIKAVQDMNLLAIKLGVDQIYNGNLDADSIETFCRDVVKEYFDGRSR